MLKCRDVAHEATDYLEQSQSRRRRWAMQLHLLICHHCRRFVNHLRIVRDMARLRPTATDSLTPEKANEITRHTIDKTKQDP